jgi:hypothetical protein
MSKKKIRQGQSRWMGWVYQDVVRQPDGSVATDPQYAPCGDYRIERVVVLSAFQGRIVCSINGNTSTFTEAQFRGFHRSRNAAMTVIKQHLAQEGLRA